MGSREDSPDWIRSFKAPQYSVLSLSSSSDSSPISSPKREEDDVLEEPSADVEDRDGNQGLILVGEEEDTPSKKTQKPKTFKRKRKVEDATIADGDVCKEEAANEEIMEKQAVDTQVSSRVPLVLPEKVQRSKALVECEGDSIDLSGDVGAVGRIVVSDSAAGNPEMLFDLKGTVYKTSILPSRTFCIVSFGQTEAKIEAVMNDFIQLKPHSNVFEAETMVEGTLEGFSFDSEDEEEKMPNASCRQSNKQDDNEDPSDPIDAKPNGKAQKSVGVMRKKSKTTAKPPKMGGRKAQAPKKAKKAKKTK